MPAASPMSRSSKSLPRTFESVLTKNESGQLVNEARPSAKYNPNQQILDPNSS